MKVKVTVGTSWCGTNSESVEFEVADKKEFDSDEFSTTILNALSCGEFGHYWLDYDITEDEEDEDEEDE